MPRRKDTGNAWRWSGDSLMGPQPGNKFFRWVAEFGPGERRAADVPVPGLEHYTERLTGREETAARETPRR